MINELGLVLKHITEGAEKINVVNYLSKPPPPNDECFYAEKSYAVNEQTGFPTECLRLKSGESAPRSRELRSDLW